MIKFVTVQAAGVKDNFVKISLNNANITNNKLLTTVVIFLNDQLVPYDIQGMQKD